MGHGRSGSGPGPAVVATAPTAGGLTRPGYLLPWGRGAPNGPGMIIHSVAPVTGLEHAARTRRLMGVHPRLRLPVSRQHGTSHRTLVWLQLGPA